MIWALNWVAQGCLLVAVAAGGLRLLGRVRATTRSRVHWAVLALTLALPLAEARWRGPAIQQPVVGVPAPSESRVGVPQRALVTVRPGTGIQATAAPVLSLLWAVWVAVCGIRLAAEIATLARARRRATPLPPGVLAKISPATIRRLTTAGARVAISSDVRAAAVLGWRTPIVALHPVVAERLVAADMEQVLVHEWAHIVRRDPLATVVLRAIHAVVGWHPAIHVVLRALRQDSELACDEVAVSVTGSPRALAACLTRLAELTHGRLAQGLSPAVLSRRGLIGRVEYLLTHAHDGPPRAAVGASTVIVAALAGSAVMAGGLPLVALAPRSPSVAAGAKGDPAWASGRESDPTSPDPTSNPASSGTTPAVDARMTMGTTGAASTSASGTTPAPASGAAVALASARAEASASLGPTGARPAITMSAASVGPELQTDPPGEPALLPAASLVNIMTAPTVTGRQTPAAADDGRLQPATAVWDTASTAAAATGMQIGRTSRDGALSTAGFFTRAAKRVAASF